MTVRLTLILILSFLALAQDENIGDFLGNAAGALWNIDSLVLGKELELGTAIGGAALDLGAKAINSLVGDGAKNDFTVDGSTPDSLLKPVAGGSASDGTVKPVADGSASDGTVKPVADGSASDGTVKPVADGSASDGTVKPVANGSAADDTVKPVADGSASDDTVKPVAGGPASDATTKPATETGSSDEQTNEKITNEVTTNPSSNLLAPQPNNPPDFQLSVSAEQGPPPNPVKTSLDDECDSTNSKVSDSDSSCKRPTPRIIWPMACGDSTEIRDALIMVQVDSNNIRTSEDSCGTSFLTAPMTEEQVGNVLKNDQASIKTIVADDHVISDGLSGNTKPGKRKKSRRDNIISVKPAPSHLHAISVPWRTGSEYLYLENAGQSIDGYMLVLADERMESTNREFTTGNIIKENIRALVPVTEMVDDHDELPGSALSLVSLVGGESFGVIKKASLTLIALAPRTSSFLDGLKIIERRIRDRLSTKQQVLAHTVVMTPIGFRSLPILNVVGDSMAASPTNEQEALSLVKILIDELQVVFVCAAGEIKTDGDGTLVQEPYLWPANWASRPDAPPIISVGGADQSTGRVAYRELDLQKSGSVSGALVTVYAPYYTFAVFGEGIPQPAAGTRCSAALVMGLAMGFLSQPDVREELDLQENEEGRTGRSTSLKISEYIVDKAFERTIDTDGPRVIWNGLGIEGTQPGGNRRWW